MEILNKVELTYRFGDDDWQFDLLLTPEDVDQYFGGNAICKSLFTFLDYERLVKEEGFNQFLKDKYQKDAYEEYRRYML